jgi:hypothetical protein
LDAATHHCIWPILKLGGAAKTHLSQRSRVINTYLASQIFLSLENYQIKQNILYCIHVQYSTVQILVTNRMDSSISEEIIK